MLQPAHSPRIPIKATMASGLESNWKHVVLRGLHTLSHIFGHTTSSQRRHSTFSQRRQSLFCTANEEYDNSNMGSCSSSLSGTARRSRYTSVPATPSRPQYRLLLHCTRCDPGKCPFTQDVNYNGKTLAHRRDSSCRSGQEGLRLWHLEIDFCDLADRHHKARGVLDRFTQDQSIAMGDGGKRAVYEEPICVEDLLQALRDNEVGYWSSL
ncbi:hypothetical protein N656DRAFT_639243 [Canariomyces notabilis]|uniref:Uncharacterized protein n=1 Tax=Canariomyces notabilis TaxID=2074819 RepID=A0AAN6TF46_9PEZI|nr:hypothetical protein N656DRAFT_639243 [Canariomyces arenarius]